jgi:hypothetical protein
MSIRAMDKILELMQDSEWHSTNEIEKKAEFYFLPKEKSKEIRLSGILRGT